jgi:hypothetical protein
MPIEFAMLLANIVLMVKPVEAEFSAALFETSPEHTRAFMFTQNGAAVVPEKMNHIMSQTLQEYGFLINISDLRHAMEAFAHKLGKPTAVWDPYLTRTANHNSTTSGHYGRDEHCVRDVPADVSQANAIRLVG